MNGPQMIFQQLEVRLLHFEDLASRANEFPTFDGNAGNKFIAGPVVARNQQASNFLTMHVLAAYFKKKLFVPSGAQVHIDLWDTVRRQST
jgi:hypothetical protein